MPNIPSKLPIEMRLPPAIGNKGDIPVNGKTVIPTRASSTTGSDIFD